MAHTLHIQADIPANRKVQITLPPEIPSGEADLTVTVRPRTVRRGASDLINSEIFGMWADREDISDSAAFARDLRKQAWGRSDQ